MYLVPRELLRGTYRGSTALVPNVGAIVTPLNPDLNAGIGYNFSRGNASSWPPLPCHLICIVFWVILIKSKTTFGLLAHSLRVQLLVRLDNIQSSVSQ